LNIKVAKWAKYYLPNFHANPHYQYPSCFFFVPSVFGKSIPTAAIGMIRK
jgi:hypothetical protein